MTERGSSSPHALRFIMRPVAALALVAAWIMPCHAHAADAGRVIVTEENDALASQDDRHYTQGLQLSYLSGEVTPDDAWDQPFSWLSGALPIFGEATGERKRKYEWIVLGQSQFTPDDILVGDPDRRDRPYAGWLYTGVSLLQETDRDALENLELLVGVVGPAALGRQTQNDFHQLLGSNEARGWGHQLKNEPGLVLSYERKWRFEQTLVDGLAIDLVPEVGASVGNVLTYGEAGGIVRFGQNLAADYGPVHVRPGLSGTGWFDADRLDGDFGWYLFAGVQGRAVGRNIFLDGNSFRDSRSVDKRPFVADLVGGASLFWSDLIRLDFTVIQRTKEFDGPLGTDDRFGGINLSFRFW